MLTSVVIFEFAVATNGDLLDAKGGLAFRGIAFDRTKNVVVEVYLARTAFDNDFAAAI
jgi:hypothetical protein